jgi:hypothetical protein
MQERIAKRIRISILLWSALLALLSPYFFEYYAQRQNYQWEAMVQPHWQPVVRELPIAELDVAVQDAEEWKNLDVEIENAVLPETAPPDSPVTPDSALTVSKAPSAQKVPIQDRNSREQPASKQERKLTLALPDNLYQGKQGDWEEKKPLVVPDFFSPKPESSDGLQFGGRLIVDEEKAKNKEDKAESSYLDAVQGAEINIKIKTK